MKVWLFDIANADETGRALDPHPAGLPALVDAREPEAAD